MSRSIYLFRNIRTRQVVTTTHSSILSSEPLLKHQLGYSKRQIIPTIRPDHWVPLVVLTGFEDAKSHNDTFNLVSQPGHPLTPPGREASERYLRLPNALKQREDRDMVERQVAQLARALVHQNAAQRSRGGQMRLLLWEHQSRQWIRKIEEAGLAWPQWVKHGTLDVKRGSIILNPELQNPQSVQPVRPQIGK